MRKPLVIGSILIGSASYWIYTYNGAQQIHKVIDVDSAIFDDLIIISRITSCLSNAFFLYQIGMKFNPRIESKRDGLILFAMPFGALQFFTGGLLGARLWGLSELVSIMIGFSLFGMRVFSLVDSSRRIPAIIKDIANSIRKIYSNHDLPELLRSTLTFGVTFGLIFLSIDSMYMPLSMIFKLLGGYDSFNHYASLILAIPAAMINWPMSWYWYRRGLIQITNGGQPELNLENPDPTDRYTGLALGMSFLLIIQVVSRLSGATGPLSEYFGFMFSIASVLISLLFTVAATVPNNASTLRDAGSYLGKKLFPQTQSHEIETTRDEASIRNAEEGNASNVEKEDVDEVAAQKSEPENLKQKAINPGKSTGTFFYHKNDELADKEHKDLTC